MTAWVFTGPSLPPGEAPAIEGFRYLPPARQGDVYRVALRAPSAIGIVDGYFESVPSVWHKEVLWAMKQGIPVYGAASMGALRAAELAEFGMRGVGFVFEAYRDGLLEDDDEVAVVHAPDVPEYGMRGFRPITEAMVNVRATLAAALDAGTIPEQEAVRVFDAAKGLNYRDRTWSRILDVLAGGVRDRLAASIAEHRVDQKRLDALEMLDAMRAELERGPAPMRLDWRFEHTVKWDGLVVRANADPGPHDDETGRGDGLLEELRVEASDYASIWQRSLLRAIAALEAARADEEPGAMRIEDAERRFLAERGIATEADRTRWMAGNALEPDGFARLIAEQARLEWLGRTHAPGARRHLAAELRAGGRFERLARRAADKRRVLAAWGLEQPTLEAAGVDEPALIRWYFRDRIGAEVPADVPAFARGLGFGSENAFVSALLREYCYLARRGGGASVADQDASASQP